MVTVNVKDTNGKFHIQLSDRLRTEPLGQPTVARQLTAGAVSTNTALTTTCRRISILAQSANIRFSIGSTAQTATSSSHLILTNERLDLVVPATPNIAVLRVGGSDGVLEVMELI